MIYQDYMRRKMHNVVKIDTAEGYPLTVYSCANTNLKDYTIYGNTGGVGDKTENLFDISKSDGFTSQYTGITNTIIDNVITVSSTTNRIGYLTLGTFEAGTYYIGMTSEDYTGIKHIVVNDVNSQISVNNLITISKRSVIKIMINVGAGTTWHFTNIQITKSNVATSYEPYDKYKIPITVTGKNLFDKSISIRDDIRNETTITSSDYSVPILNNNDICKILKPDTTYTISCEFECTAIPSDSTYRHGVLGFIASTGVEGYSRISATIDKQILVGERYKFSKTFTTPSNFGTEGKYSFVIYRNAYYKGNITVAASMICRNLQIEEGTSATSYEPYHEPVTTNIFRDAPLADGESINYKNDNLPDITLEKGTNTITADTEVKPSSIKIKYLKK